MEYDLEKIIDHPLMLDELLPSALIVFGGMDRGEFSLKVRWRCSTSDTERHESLRIHWDANKLEERYPGLRAKIRNILERDRYRKLRTENAAVIVSVAVMENIDPGTRFSMRSDSGTFRDYYLNESLDEMIEIAGRASSKKGLNALYLEEKTQSDRNARLRKRWVSVTVFSKRPRNRTEGQHS